MVTAAHDLRGYSVCYFKEIVPIYPGVPLVSWALLGFHIRAMPKSVMCRYPKSRVNRRFGTGCIEHQVLWLYVSVDNAVVVNIFEANDHAGDHELYVKALQG